MMYTLYLASAGDDKHTAYSFLLADYHGCEIDSDVFLAIGERQHDESFCGHIALQRALRRAAKHPEVTSLHIAFDAELLDPVGYELMGMNSPPLYPSLCRTTQRIIARFNRHGLGVFHAEKCDRPEEAAVIDNALQALEDSRSFVGRAKVLRDSFLYPTKIIKG